jgi:hypothetical protein
LTKQLGLFGHVNLWLERLTLKMTRWIYNQILIPKLTYGCVTWWRTRVTQFANKLNKLQRMIELTISDSLKSTPTAALNAALGLPPLEIRLRRKLNALR